MSSMRQRGGVADQVDFRQGLLGALFLVDAGFDLGQLRQMVEQLAVFWAVGLGVGGED